MFLKRISVCGFKSFCDRVEFDIGRGVTCIVGPNGCGKSNVVDAIKWVLGEQSARALRGRQMTDMIFNGSSTRRSSSLAQVDLLFDNCDGSPHSDRGEIMISRKLYRSGESEYLINKIPARLKDVREMFLDTGVGVDAYSIIEQGKVDVLLQNNPQERRTIFEEAAGISRYKARKHEAQRKLERTDQNLLRVEDVIEELEKRLRSVKLQAGKARNFKEYEARLNELRSRFAMAEYYRYSAKITELSCSMQESNDRAMSLRTDIDRHEKNETIITVHLDEISQEISTTDNQLVQAKARHVAQEERIEAAGRRAEEQRSSLDRLQERLDTDLARLEGDKRAQDELQETAASIQEETHAHNARISELNESDRLLAREFAQAQAILEDEKSGIIELLRKSAQAHNEVVRLNTHRESLVGQKGRLSQRDATLRSELESTLSQKIQLERKLTEIDKLIAEETRRLDEKKIEASRLGGLRQQLVDELAGVKEARSALLSRRELLQDLQRKMDGVGAGARTLLDKQKLHPDDEALGAIVGLVADIFDVDVRNAPVIEAALGDQDRHLVVSDRARFLDHPELTADLPGRLPVLFRDRLPPIVNARSFADQPGFVARAIDLVRFAEEDEQLARHLLGKTIVVDSLDAAMSMAEADVAGHRFVTRDGVVIEPDGLIRFGPPNSEAGLISRKSELRDIDQRMIEIEERTNTLADRLNRTEAEASHLEDVQQELRTAVYECNTTRIEANAALQTISESIERLAGEQPLISQEVSLIEQQLNDVLQKATEGGRSLEAIERENEERQAQISGHQARIDEIVDQREQAQAQLTEAKVSAGQLAEKRAATATTIATLRIDIQTLENACESARSEIGQSQSRIDESVAVVESGQNELITLHERIESYETACDRFRREREQQRTELDGLTNVIKIARNELASALEEMHEREMALTESKVRRSELATRVQDELDIDLSSCLEQYQPEDQNWEEVESEITELRRKMDRLGNVNLGAIDELQELEQRHSFLTTQRDDLADSRRQLEQLIDKLNAESETRFLETMDKIRENFRTLFRKLFGGGRADIILEDSENVLESGIEIVAQPPGKELRAISLMSGGEKSMTAIALLMSIFKTRPAPFAILDEVDAALDETNNDRFNRIVQEFVSESQFIIITHSKRTMSIGDQLYGITMQEPGVSARMSVQLTDTHVA